MLTGERVVSIKTIERASAIYRAKMCDERYTPEVSIEEAERFTMAPTFAEFLEVNGLVVYEKVAR